MNELFINFIKRLNQNKMEINQLRIGNLVLNSWEGNNVEVTIDTLMSLESTGSNSKYKPIPLTEEWLLKFGFKKSNVYCFGNHKLIIESLMGDRHSCRYRVNPDESIWISELHYVHQLQNLYFSLVGEELTFKSE